MREGSLARRATGFGAALIAATGLISLLPRPGLPDPAVEGPRPGAEGPAERHLPTAGHEARDVGFWQMASGALGVLAFVGFGVGVAYWLYPAPDKTLAFQPPAAYPVPTLQSDTVADMDRFREEQLQQLNRAYWIDRAGGTVHLPIEDAMRLVAQDGIADWPRAPYPPVVPAR